MPADKKQLPRPCPQCGLDNGGMQWVIFNPRFSNTRGFNEIPYSIIRISHYSKELYSQSSKRKKKIWHNFWMPLSGIRKGPNKIMLKEIFNEPAFVNKTSITIPLKKEWFEYFQKYGWRDLETKRAHFIKKAN